jgi:molybdopterin biosynthesis enzyme
LEEFLGESEAVVAAKRVAPLAAPVRVPQGLRVFYRAEKADHGRRVRAAERQGSAELGSFARSSQFVVLPESGGEIAAGTEVEVVSLW